MRAELVKLIRGVIDAQQAEAAETALQQLLAHPQGKALGQHLSALMERLFVYQMDYCRGLQRVSPEWYGATSACGSATGATIAQSSVWNGRRCCGQSITTSSPLNGDRNTNDTIDILEECLRGRCAARTSQLSGCFGRLNAHGVAAHG